MAYKIIWLPNGVYKKFYGITTIKEMLKCLQEVQSHPNYDTFKFTITDINEAQITEMNETDMAAYGAYAIGGQYTNGKLLIGIVTSSIDVIYLLVEKYSPIVNYKIGYFDNLQECVDWISKSIESVVEIDFKED